MNNSIDKNTFRNLLATTTREKEDSYVVSELFSLYPSILELLNVTEEELLQIKGIGKVKSKQIIAVLQLARMNPNPVEQLFTIRSLEDAYSYLIDLQYLQKEHFGVLGLNTKNQVLFRKTIFIGSLNACIAEPRAVFNKLLRRNCASAILFHNHLSLDPSPSQEDIHVTKRMAEVGKLTQIEIINHIIVGGEKYTSLKERGYL